MVFSLCEQRQWECKNLGPKSIKVKDKSPLVKTPSLIFSFRIIIYQFDEPLLPLLCLISCFIDLTVSSTEVAKCWVSSLF